ncbi:hypothetical protein D9O29_23865, partial [Pantoea vagans]
LMVDVLILKALAVVHGSRSEAVLVVLESRGRHQGSKGKTWQGRGEVAPDCGFMVALTDRNRNYMRHAQFEFLATFESLNLVIKCH